MAAPHDDFKRRLVFFLILGWLRIILCLMPGAQRKVVVVPALAENPRTSSTVASEE